MKQKKIEMNQALIPVIFGNLDEYRKMISEALGVKIASSNGVIMVEGESAKVDETVSLISHLKKLAETSGLSKSDVNDALKMIKSDSGADVSGVIMHSVKVSGRVKSVSAKSPNQQSYLKAIDKNDLVFGIGPAGTGKTFLAMAMGVHYYLTKKVGRIILTRPAVEAGEKLGFLPGDIADKVNPYLRPLYDALFSMMDMVKVTDLLEQGIIEVAPLAFMRGRTLNDSFIILDEAQNTTPEQMKMFLTRIGFQSKAVVTGDVTQVDLPSDRKSGLIQVSDILQDVQGVEFVNFSEKDVVRHNLVQRIIRAYDKYEGK